MIEHLMSSSLSGDHKGVESTNDPLRMHAGDGPAGSTADVYQFLLELAAHSTRHTAQIREVQLAAGYPE